MNAIGVVGKLGEKLVVFLNKNITANDMANIFRLVKKEVVVFRNAAFLCLKPRKGFNAVPTALKLQKAGYHIDIPQKFIRIPKQSEDADRRRRRDTVPDLCRYFFDREYKKPMARDLPCRVNRQ